MKKLIILSLVALFATGISYGQKADLKGPKAKNQKVWENKYKAKNKLVTASKKEDIKGPKAKNQKPFQNEVKVDIQDVKNDNPKKKLKGPKGKNFKYFWKKKSEDEKEEEADNDPENVIARN